MTMANGSKTTAGNDLPAENPAPPRRLRLNSVAGCRATLARFIRLYDQGVITESHLRAMVYALSSLLAYWRSEVELSIDERLTRLEEKAGLK